MSRYTSLDESEIPFHPILSSRAIEDGNIVSFI